MAGSIELYNKKRDFTITSEPPGKKAKRAGSSFVIQKHAARRLHYDFRLEMDGVLKSWAVAKGPSLVPGEKRLAVHVEDHPLDYGGFEGTIPEGQYGAGSVILWDRGTWIPDGDPHKGYAKGHLDFTLEGEKLKGRWHLVRMRGKPGEKTDNWLLIKSEDEAARDESEPDILEEQPRSVKSGKSISQIAGDKKARQWNSSRPAATRAPAAGGAKTPRQRAAEALQAAPVPEPADVPRKLRANSTGKTSLAKNAAKTSDAAQAHRSAKVIAVPSHARKAKQPDFVEPELATLSEKPPKGVWLHEVKFDGYRMQAVRAGSKTRMRTRRGLDWTERFATIADAVSALPIESITLDGEVVVEDASGVSDFAGLQQALSEGRTERLAYYCFDCLYLDGHDLRTLPLRERKAVLAEVLAAAPSPVLRFSDHFEEHGELMLQHICRLSAEGIVSKRPDAPYRSGRGGDWLKSKCANRQEFVVIGYVPSTAAKRAIGSLVLGYYEDGKPRHAGRVGTGFSANLAAELFAMLEHEKVDRPPTDEALSTDVRRNVKWVAPKRVAEVEFRGWTGTGQLRQASFKGLREDKDPTEVVREGAPKAAPAGSRREPAPTARLTHADRVLWPEAGVTKQGLADYYASVWPWIKPFVTGRPLALVRCPTGIARGCFFQKHGWEGMDPHIVRITDPTEDEPAVGIDDLEGLFGLAQASVLEIHPWGARSGDLDRPDMLTIDLDPGEGVIWGELVAAARETRERLQALGLESFVKTTGGKGLHVVVPLVPRAGWDAAKAFCRSLAEAMTKDAPDRFVATATKAARTRKIYVDYLRNGRGATAVCAYSTRARPECGVSTPLTWAELDAISGAGHFTLANLDKRLAYLKKDPWAGFFETKQALPSDGSAVVGHESRR